MISFFHRYLEPAEVLAELLFGLIMVLTCTLGAGVIVAGDREGLRSLIVAALGCNVAWGVIDAALYVLGNVFVRSRNARLMRAIQSAADDTAALEIVRRHLEPRIEALGRTEDRERLYREFHAVAAGTDSLHSHVTSDDLMGAIAVFLLVAGTAVPAAIPFVLIANPLLALPISNLVLVALLFVVGFRWAYYTDSNKWWAGLATTLFGLFLVAIARALGG